MLDHVTVTFVTTILIYFTERRQGAVTPPTPTLSERSNSVTTSESSIEAVDNVDDEVDPDVVSLPQKRQKTPKGKREFFGWPCTSLV